jgi:cell wall-associated NlpC family hydrolase
MAAPPSDGGATTTAAAASAPAPAQATTTAAPATPGESSVQATAVAVALAQVGKPYQWGGAGPASFDCSGLVMYAYEAAGVDLAHFVPSQQAETTPVSESQLEPGDLVFYDNDSGPQPGHVAIYIGNGEVVSANSAGSDVQTQSLYYDGTPVGFGEVG